MLEILAWLTLLSVCALIGYAACVLWDNGMIVLALIVGGIALCLALAAEFLFVPLEFLWKWLFYKIFRSSWSRCSNPGCFRGFIKEGYETCTCCGGSGVEWSGPVPGAIYEYPEPSSCPSCSGKGGYYRKKACPVCRGEGWIPPNSPNAS